MSPVFQRCDIHVLFLIKVYEKAVCFMYSENVSVLKRYNLYSAYNVAKHIESFCDSDFFKNYMRNLVYHVSPKHNKNMKNSSIEEIDEDRNSQLKKLLHSFKLFYLKLD
ncbi:hypothetical protein RF11_12338 [Thelohanellus kitauei]|uniref:Uncharacterized protein n=1 Tax=Thelohanellus kitauei TaxID=669202 RepID=A0A0C2M6J0_THEKT|nr:hypothetical protein RF11_12338 [Thelohanellus kitauei]